MYNPCQTIARINAVVAKHSEEHQTSPATSPKLQPRRTSDKSTPTSSSVYPTSPLSGTDSSWSAAGSNPADRPMRKLSDLSNPTSLKMESFDMPDEAISHLPLIINKRIHEYRKPKAR